MPRFIEESYVSITWDIVAYLLLFVSVCFWFPWSLPPSIMWNYYIYRQSWASKNWCHGQLLMQAMPRFIEESYVSIAWDIVAYLLLFVSVCFWFPWNLPPSIMWNYYIYRSRKAWTFEHGWSHECFWKQVIDKYALWECCKYLLLSNYLQFSFASCVVMYFILSLNVNFSIIYRCCLFCVNDMGGSINFSDSRKQVKKHCMDDVSNQHREYTSESHLLLAWSWISCNLFVRNWLKYIYVRGYCGLTWQVPRSTPIASNGWISIALIQWVFVTETFNQKFIFFWRWLIFYVTSLCNYYYYSYMFDSIRKCAWRVPRLHLIPNKTWMSIVWMQWVFVTKTNRQRFTCLMCWQVFGLNFYVLIAVLYIDVGRHANIGMKGPTNAFDTKLEMNEHCMDAVSIWY